MRPIKTVIVVVVLLASIVLITAKQHVIKPAVGDIAPEISMQSPTGKTIKLSSLWGKVVLVDFWASWCRSCRIENNTIRQAYDIYKTQKFNIGNGFEVYSVSLDNNLAQWQKAIGNDRLSWSSHVCDFKKWDSPIVEKYNFRYLPHNVLIDQNGVIVAKGLYGSQLEETLKEHLAE